MVLLFALFEFQFCQNVLRKFEDILYFFRRLAFRFVFLNREPKGAGITGGDAVADRERTDRNLPVLQRLLRL